LIQSSFMPLYMNEININVESIIRHAYGWERTMV